MTLSLFFQIISTTIFEWFQWLAERMMEQEQHRSAIPAYIAHKNWKARSK